MTLIYYFLALSLITFFVFGYDKQAAKMSRWRIPEKVLLGLVIAGGALGGLLGMQFFRHKTRKLHFWVVCIAALLLHFFLVVLSGGNL